MTRASGIRLGGVAALLALALTATAANATDFCNNNGTVVRVGAANVNVLYVAVDTVFCHCYLFSIWVYAETNGQPDLQRGGETLLGDADICQDSATPDQGIF